MTVSLHGLIFDFKFPDTDFLPPEPSVILILLACLFLSPSLFLCLSFEGKQVFSPPERGDKCTGLSERRGKVRPVTGAGTLAVGNLNLNPDRGRSRAITEFAYGQARERG